MCSQPKLKTHASATNVVMGPVVSLLWMDSLPSANVPNPVPPLGTILAQELSADQMASITRTSVTLTWHPVASPRTFKLNTMANVVSRNLFFLFSLGLIIHLEQW